MNKKVAIYTTPTCTYCRMSKQFFKEKNIAYDEYDVQSDLIRRQEMIEKSGQMGVPVIAISEADGSQEELIVGFDRRALEKGLGLA